MRYFAFNKKICFKRMFYYFSESAEGEREKCICIFRIYEFYLFIYKQFLLMIYYSVASFTCFCDLTIVNIYFVCYLNFRGPLWK